MVEKAYVRGTLNDNDGVSVKAETENKLDWKAQKEEQARLRKKQNEIARIEKEIASLEEEGAFVDKELENPAYFTDHVKLGELTKRKNEIEEKLLELMDEWEKINE